MPASPEFWLHAQSVWLGMAIAYNLIGIWRKHQGRRALVGDQPERALISLGLFGIAILVGYLGWDTVYRFYTPVATLLLARVGFWRHIDAARTEKGRAAYSSPASWRWAVAINGYGTAVFIIGVLAVWGVVV